MALRLSPSHNLSNNLTKDASGGPAREPLCDDKPTKTPLGNQLHGWKIPQWQAMDCEGHLVVPQTRFFILRERGKVQQGKSNPENESI
jgi:hypothetical protein